jgi:hypothetical protein
MMFVLRDEYQYSKQSAGHPPPSPFSVLLPLFKFLPFPSFAPFSFPSSPSSFPQFFLFLYPDFPTFLFLLLLFTFYSFSLSLFLISLPFFPAPPFFSFPFLNLNPFLPLSSHS